MAARKAGRRLAAAHFRLGALGVGLALAWMGMGLRLYQVQVVQAPDLAERGVAQRQIERELNPQRGNIFDRNGDPLAMTVEAASIFVNPQELTEPVYVAQQIGGMLGRDHNALVEQFQSDSQFVYLRRQVELERAAEIIDLGLPGIYSHPEPKRVYPTGTVASHVVGFVNIDGVGAEGIEHEFDDLLKGTPGELRFEQAPNGVPIPWAPTQSVPAIPGDDLVTTIDLPIQYSAEEACKSTLQVTGGTACWIVALAVETGDVLAVAGAPQFDPAIRQGVDGSAFGNFAVRGMYEPGSTQKLITFAAALDQGIVRPDTLIRQIDDVIELRPEACKRNDDEIFGCYKDFESHEVEDMAVADVFRRSSNVGTIKIAQLMPPGVVGQYLTAFGLGEQTGIDYPGEAAGLINLDPSCEVCPLSASIGYGVAVTSLQMAAAYAAIGNDGVWIQPHIVTAAHGLDSGREIFAPATRQVVGEAIAQQLRAMLSDVVEAGTGVSAQIPGYRVGGKTGTANKLGDDGRYTDITMASFVGMAPIDDPRVVVAVVVDSPTFEYRTGGLAAAPAFAQVMEQALHRLGVTPDAGSG
ncbi:MAG TPA: penicillin-binding protein 2 [Acidimicrobiia bacterium]|nr:penicillin-binding protein 2 [Acidimicrobiia bacterium]